MPGHKKSVISYALLFNPDHQSEPHRTGGLTLLIIRQSGCQAASSFRRTLGECPRNLSWHTDIMMLHRIR